MQATYTSPSNIAIVKYWGKHGIQLPQNPNLSLTLHEAHTRTALTWQPRPADEQVVSLDFAFHGQANDAFKTKIVKFLESITAEHFPFLREYHLDIASENTFPHSSGIASSASAMSALAMCLCDMERSLQGTLASDADFRRKASVIARLGSGSACRSVYPFAAEWGRMPALKGSSDDFATPLATHMHDVFKTYRDAILIVSKAEKSVSSRAGHGLMEGNAFARPRYAQARARMKTLLAAMRTGDIETFGQISEDEALTLHALMMTGSPSYILMRPNSLRMIEMIRAYRAETRQPLYFSLDAGPNLHLLYPEANAAAIEAFITSELIPLCEDGRWIADRVGLGAAKVN